MIKRLSFCLLILVMMIGCSPNSKCEVYIVPENFKGWVFIEYGVAGVPELPLRDGVRQVELPHTRIPPDKFEVYSWNVSPEQSLL